jgi:hypothetical protein
MTSTPVPARSFSGRRFALGVLVMVAVLLFSVPLLAMFGLNAFGLVAVLLYQVLVIVAGIVAGVQARGHGYLGFGLGLVAGWFAGTVLWLCTAYAILAWMLNH